MTDEKILEEEGKESENKETPVNPEENIPEQDVPAAVEGCQRLLTADGKHRLKAVVAEYQRKCGTDSRIVLCYQYLHIIALLSAVS